MGWGERRKPSPGTDEQIADAHAALDAAGIRPGPLAVRAIEAAAKLDRRRSDWPQVFMPDDYVAPNGAYC
jgi:hypothetical protein